MVTAAIPSASPDPARRGPALLIVAALLCAVVIVDPVREFMSQDDGWAYARSVEHLLRTGEYRLDAWSAANMPVQIYLAAGLAEMFGYSLSLLRVSTLVLLVAGLAALYGLLRRGSLPPWPAAVLALGFLASPLVLMLSFTFMSDIQFTGWLLIALWLYSRGFESRSDRDLLLGSVAAACAIGTRQFGMALVAGVVVAWVVSGPARRPALRSLLWALTLPLTVSAWQLSAGLAAPNFTQAMRLHEQADFLTVPPSTMAHEVGWRLSTVLQYLGLSLLPVLPLLASLCLARAYGSDGPQTVGTKRAASSSERSSEVTAVLALLTLAGLLLFSLKNSDISTRENSGHLLPLPWMLPTAFWSKTWLMRGFAASGVIGAFFLLLLFWRWQGTRPRVRDLSWQALLTMATGLSLVALHLSYVQINDTYLVGMLPFVLLVIGGALATRAPATWVLAVTVAWSFAILVVLSAWMRGDYNRQQAQWASADRLVASGTPPRCIGATRHWAEYHGAFDDWLAAKSPHFELRHDVRSPAPPRPMHDPFYAWMEARSWDATYQLTSGFEEALKPGWKVIADVPYRSATFAPRSIQVLQRQTPQSAEAEPCPAPAVAP
jgi:hypothetical protein